MKLFLFLIILQLKPSLTTQQDTSGCGTQYGCYISPTSCEANACKFIFKWLSTDDDEFVRFILSVNRDSGLVATGSYLAIGLSSDQTMSDDSVSICKSTTNTVEQYYNVDRIDGPVLLNTSNPSIGLSNITVTQSNSWLVCSFNRLKQVNETDKYFDTGANKSYFVLASHGQVSSDGTLEYHGASRAFSSSVVSFTMTKVASNDNTQVAALKSHGCLMVFTWCLCVPVGIFFARYFKYLLAKKTMCNVPFWFVIHRPLLVIAPFIAICAFLIAFASLNFKWIPYNDKTLTLDFVHSIFGAVTLILAVIQSILGFSRPPVIHKYRYIYNHSHRFIGMAIFICSVIAMYTGISLKMLSLHRVGWVILTFWLLITILMVIAIEYLEVHMGEKVLTKTRILTVLPVNTDMETLKANRAFKIKKLHIIKTQMFISYLFISTFLTLSIIVVIIS